MADPEELTQTSISKITEDGSGSYEITIRFSAECDPQALSQQLQSGTLQWKAMSCENASDAIRLEMMKKMAPTPVVKFVLESDMRVDEPRDPPASSDYFQSYGDVEVHELMLRDHPRMEAYHAAIQKFKHRIEGKAVLDVGTGTGVLAMMAAKAGARVVYAVEASSTAQLATQLVEANGLGGIVQVIHAAVEDVELPEKVDVLVSEWMGFYLLHESMLESVLFARDRWLNENGLMLPSRASIHACPVSWDRGRAEHVSFWQDCYGLDLRLLGEQKLARMAGKPLVEDIATADLLCEPQPVCDLDLHTVRPQELAVIECALPFTCGKAGAQLAGLAIWFDCHFEARSGSSTGHAAGSGGAKRKREDGDGDGVVLSTSPGAASTHWKQTTIFLGGFFDVAEGEELPMTLRLVQDADNPRTYALTVQT